MLDNNGKALPGDGKAVKGDEKALKGNHKALNDDGKALIGDGEEEEKALKTTRHEEASRDKEEVLKSDGMH